jgi:transposase
MSRRAQPPYPPELRERAVRMVAEVATGYGSPWAAMNAVAEKLGVGTGKTVRKWVRQAEIDGGTRPGTTPRSPRSSSGCAGRTPSCAGPMTS